MAIDFTGNAGRVRMLSGDTDESNKINSDDEITAFLALNSSSVYSAAADACRAIAAKAARGAFAFSLLIGNVKIDKTKIPKWYLELADTYAAMDDPTDTTDYMVEWHLHIDPIHGRDDSEYSSSEDSDEDYYHDINADYGE